MAIVSIPPTFSVGDVVKIKIFRGHNRKSDISVMICRVDLNNEYPYGIVTDQGTYFNFKAYELELV